MRRRVAEVAEIERTGGRGVGDCETRLEGCVDEVTR